MKKKRFMIALFFAAVLASFATTVFADDNSAWVAACAPLTPDNPLYYVLFCYLLPPGGSPSGS